MHVALCRVSLRLHGSRSLKQKRQISASIIPRIRRRFNVAIAEIDDNNLWQRLTLGISFVSNDSRHVNEVISKVLDHIIEIKGEVELLDHDLEMISAF